MAAERRASHAKIDRRYGRPVYDSWSIEPIGELCDDGHPMYWLGLGLDGHKPNCYILTCSYGLQALGEEALRRHEAHEG